MKKAHKFIRQYPGQTIFASIIVIIIIGTLLLSLPQAQTTKIAWIDLFFLTTSLITVTGLKTISLSNFTLFGKSILIGLMQIGGLGLIIVSFAILQLFFDIGIYTEQSIAKITDEESFQETKRILFFIFKFTIIAETIGTGIIFYIIHNDYLLQESILLSIFHAVSYFCNVGISLYAQESLAYNTSLMMQCIKSILILLGALGFVTWHEIINRIQKKHDFKFSWQTIVALKTFLWIIFFTTLLFFSLEFFNCLSDLNVYQKIFNSIFIGISSSNCGDFPFLLEDIHPATLLLILCIGFIGSAPSSTGGGIKTNAFAIFLGVIKSAFLGTYQVIIHNHRINKDQIYNAMTLIFVAISWIIITLFCLLISEQLTIFDLSIETISAFSNTGISTGATTHLSIIGKIIIITTMIFGRIGTFIFATKVKIHKLSE